MVLASTQETFEWMIWKCRQAGWDICHTADGRCGLGWSSWLGVAPPGSKGSGLPSKREPSLLSVWETLQENFQDAFFLVTHLLLFFWLPSLFITSTTFPTPSTNGRELWKAFPSQFPYMMVLSSSILELCLRFSCQSSFFWWQVFGEAASLIKQCNCP